MTTMQPLFRPEVVAHATQRLDGDVLLPAPLVTWGAVAFVLAVLVLGVCFAATATHTRTESAVGWLAPQGGVARAVSRRDGTVLAVTVAEGDVVEAGAPLARVGMTAQFGSGRDPSAFSQNERTYPRGPVEQAATGTVASANPKAMPLEAAVQALVATEAPALPRDVAELAHHGSGGSSEPVERNVDYIVTAPISGHVEAIVAREGQYISRGSTVALVAASDELIAEIVVPAHVVGLVTRGQGLRLKYEGLPFGRESVQQGIVTHVSRTPLAPEDSEDAPIPVTDPAYRALVRLPAQEIDVGSASVRLHAGMRLTAEIPASRRTVFQTLYETIR